MNVRPLVVNQKRLGRRESPRVELKRAFGTAAFRSGLVVRILRRDAALAGIADVAVSWVAGCICK